MPTESDQVAVKHISADGNSALMLAAYLCLKRVRDVAVGKQKPSENLNWLLVPTVKA